MGVVIFLIGMIVGGFVGIFLLALVSANRNNDDAETYDNEEIK